MPRRARLIVPGGLYHIMARGIERRAIFGDPSDYQEFINRLGEALQKSGCRCFAWVLMPNHFHLLVQAGREGTPPLMRRLMTGYAGHFNRRHCRSGHLFQNRYKAILCEEEPYLLELIRYIHLNPFRGKIVESLDALENYSWSGHRALLGLEKRTFQAVEEALAKFGGVQKDPRSAYRRFIADGVRMGRRPDLMGGGLFRSMGQSPGHWTESRRGEPPVSDDRVLGSGGFVESVLNEKEIIETPRALIPLTLEELAEKVAKAYGVSLNELTRKGRREAVTRAKAVFIYLGTQFKKQSCRKMGELTGMTVQSASEAKFRGEAFIEDNPGLNKLIN